MLVSAAAMSIVERVSGGGGWLISHESFLEEVYSATPPLGLKPLSGIFDVRTPFRMDAEAAKAALGNQGEEDNSRRKRKRREKARRGEKSTVAIGYRQGPDHV